MFSIRGYADDFYTGRTGDRRQVILGLSCLRLVAYFFSPDGKLLSREVRPLNCAVPGTEGHGYSAYNDYFQACLGEQLRAWMKETGFVACPVCVHSFLDEEYSVGVDDEEDAGAVIHWAKEYFLSPDGEVV